MITTSAPLVEQWFVGREEYLHEFGAFLHGERNYRVLFIHGPGGIGKTWLLRRMIAKALKEGLPNLLVVDELIDMYSTTMHSSDGVRECLIGLLGESAFENYRKSQNDLRIAEREEFSEEILNNMRQRLRDNFLLDCQNLSEHKQVVVFFDTFERVQRDQVGNWVLIELARALPNFRFVVASREIWGGNTRIHSSALVGFSPKEAQKYFERRGWSDADCEILNAILELADGHPLRMELALEFLSESLLRDADRIRELDNDDFEKALIAPLQEMGQGLFGSQSFNEAIHQAVLFMAYFNRRFNTELLRLFVERGAVNFHGLQAEDVLMKLDQKFFFIKTRPDGYIQLHDEMERMINQYLWPIVDPSGEFRRELARIACQWYDAQIKLEQEATKLDDLKAEQLVYWLDVDLDKSFDLLQEYGNTSFNLNNLLVVEIRPEKVNALPKKYRYRFAIDLGDRARRVYMFKRGQDYWRIAIEVAQSEDDPDHAINTLLGLHNCTYPLDIDQSLRILLNDVLPLCDRSETRKVQVLYEIGFTYSRKQDYLKALDYYEKAKNAALDSADVVRVATILNDMGYVHVFLGEYGRAGRYVKKALDLRQKRANHLKRLLAHKKSELNSKIQGDTLDSLQEIEQLEKDLAVAWLYLGMSFNTLGQIKRFSGDLAAATGAYSEALQIFSRENVQDFSWQAKALHSRGEAHRRIAAVLFEQRRFEACSNYEERARNDFQRSLDLCDQYGVDEKHTTYRRIGRLLHDQVFRTDNGNKCLELLQKAKDNFEKGLQSARDSENVLEELENLIEIAFLVDDRLDVLKFMNGKLEPDEIKGGNNDLKPLRDAVKKYKESGQEFYLMPVFEHLLELEEGAFLFVQGKHEDALKFYAKGFCGLARERGYGVARYRQHLGHLFNQLEKLDQAKAKEWGEKFIKSWNQTEVTIPDGSKQSLAQLHPELVEEMQIYLDTAFLEGME